MQKDEIVAIFDQQASSYDTKWSKLAPLNGALHLLTGAFLADLPQDAQVLCVGAGTGAEILFLARQFPGWRFTAVEPSAAMLEVCRGRAAAAGIAARCVFHCGYLESLPGDAGAVFDAATAFLVSQFILDRNERSAFFRGIAGRLRPEGVLVSSDLAGDLESPIGREILEGWCRVMMSAGGVSAEAVPQMREAYTRDVAVYPPGDVGEMMVRGGFAAPTLFFQAGLIHAWFARRKAEPVGERRPHH